MSCIAQHMLVRGNAYKLSSLSAPIGVWNGKSFIVQRDGELEAKYHAEERAFLEGGTSPLRDLGPTKLRSLATWGKSDELKEKLKELTEQERNAFTEEMGGLYDYGKRKAVPKAPADFGFDSMGPVIRWDTGRYYSR